MRSMMGRLGRYRGLLLASTGVALCFGVGFGGSALQGCADREYFGDSGVGDVGVLGDGGNLEGLKSLRIVPEDATLYIVDSKPVSKAYKAIGTFSDGKERDITEWTSFTATDARVGVFIRNVFNAAVSWGGQTTVKASTQAGVSAETTLTVVFKRRFLGSGVPKGTDDKFAKAPKDTASPIKLVYPPDGVLVPPNLVDLEIQWLPGAAQVYFEISLTNTGTDIRIYTKCNAIGKTGGCGYVPGAAEWKAIVGAVRGNQSAQIKIRGAQSDVAKVAESNTRSLSVSDEEIKGGLYYWNATPGTIVRYDFGKTGQKAKVFYTAAHAKALFCVGCHALSLNGKRMAVGLDIPAPGPLKVLEVKDRKVLATGAANFMAFSPNGDKILTSNGTSMVFRDAATLKAYTPKPLLANGTMPDWSPDGKKVVFAASKSTLPIPVGKPGIDEGSIKIMSYDSAKNSFGAPKTLVQSSGENNYYPTYSPDNELIVFNRSNGSSYDAPDAALYAIRANGKGQVLELKNANGGTNLCNSWPKFSPFLQKYKGSQIMWLTFSSRRDYGLRLQKGSAEKGRAQLWMAAIELGKDEMGTDPSYPAFWLPFQDIKTGNHIAQWTKEVVRKKCGVDGDCPPGQVCVNGWCDPK